MLNRFLLALILLLPAASAQAQCSAGFTPASFGDSLVFTNTSTTANAHYYWSFGDGDGSNVTDPYHIYPDDGKYEVTLFARDTMTGCVDHFTAIVQVAKPDTFLCDMDGEVIVTNANGVTFYSTVNNTTGCPQFTNFDCDAGNAIDQAWSIIHDSTLGKSYWMSRIQALDTFNGSYIVLEEFYITKGVDYSNDDNYGGCSANFEVVIDYQPLNNGAEVHFQAMNDSATSYNWTVYGFGNPISLTGSSQSYFYPFTQYEQAYPWWVTLEIGNTTNGCSDTITRQFFVRNLSFEPFVDLEAPLSSFDVSLYPNPASDQVWVDLSEWGHDGLAGAGAGSGGVGSLSGGYGWDSEPVKITVFDLSGRVVKNLNSADEIRVRLDVSTWPGGLYLVDVRQGEQREVKKLLVGSR